MGTPWEKAKKKRAGYLEKPPIVLEWAFHFLWAFRFSKCPPTRQRIKKKKKCWVNVPSNYTKNKFGAGLEEEVEASST
jgi:hypothetical protein